MAPAGGGGRVMTKTHSSEPSRLARRLHTADAVIIGLGSMVGAGIFAAAGPAADAAGSGLLIGVVIAGGLSYLNETTMAQLAAVYPESGGTYVYGRERLGPFWGFLAGWGFVIGKLASCTAMALTFAFYAAPSFSRPIAVGSVLVMTLVNYLREKDGVRHEGPCRHRPRIPLCRRLGLFGRRSRRPLQAEGLDRARRRAGNPAGGRNDVLRLRGVRPGRHPPGGGGWAADHGFPRP